MKALALCEETEAILVVARLDRLSRSVEFLARLIKSDVTCRFADFPDLDVSLPGGRLVLHVLASAAQFECELSRERSRAAYWAREAHPDKRDKLIGGHCQIN